MDLLLNAVLFVLMQISEISNIPVEDICIFKVMWYYIIFVLCKFGIIFFVQSVEAILTTYDLCDVVSQIEYHIFSLFQFVEVDCYPITI